MTLSVNTLVQTSSLEPEYLTLPEAARLLRLKPTTLYTLDWPKRLAGVKVGHAWRFSRARVNAVLNGKG